MFTTRQFPSCGTVPFGTHNPHHVVLERDDAWVLLCGHRTRLTLERAEPQNRVASRDVGARSAGRKLSAVREVLPVWCRASHANTRS